VWGTQGRSLGKQGERDTPRGAHGREKECPFGAFGGKTKGGRGPSSSLGPKIHQKANKHEREGIGGLREGKR